MYSKFYYEEISYNLTNVINSLLISKLVVKVEKSLLH